MSQYMNKRRGRMDPRELIRRLVIVICLIVAFICIVKIVSVFAGYSEAEGLYGEINAGFEMATADGVKKENIKKLSYEKDDSPLFGGYEQGYSPETTSEVSGDETVPPDVTTAPEDTEPNNDFLAKLAYLETLKSQNPDTYGYIQIEGTKISYPVVQADDNDYYLQRGFNRKYLSSGTIFVDYRNSRVVEENHNLIIFGHNMLNGSMFHDLARFDSALHGDAEEFFRSHDTVTITTFDGIYTFKIFSFYQTDDSDPYLVTNFFSDSALMGYYEKAVKRSQYKTDVTFAPGDTMLTLSTCVNSKPTQRYATHAKLISVVR